MYKNINVLYLSPNDFNSYSGIQVGLKTHKILLDNIFNKKNVFSCFVSSEKDTANLFYLGHTRNKISTFIYSLFGYFRGYNKKGEKKLLKVIKQKKPKIIFVDFSCFGKTIKKIKMNYPDIKIVSFFHDINYDFESLKAKNESFLFSFIAKAGKTSEKLTCKYSDGIIALHNKDSIRINTLYKKEADCILPVCLEDKLDKDIEPNTEEYLLFVGTYFFANVDGLLYLDKKIAPYIKYKIIVIGNNIDKLKNKIKSNNIEIIGKVDNLTKYYINATAVISPIKIGSGMKIKVAEALMYGKEIIGTEESFVGYDINNSFHICHSAKDFIDTINNGKFNKYNNDARKLYEKNHTIFTNKEKLENYFKTLL